MKFFSCKIPYLLYNPLPSLADITQSFLPTNRLYKRSSNRITGKSEILIVSDILSGQRCFLWCIRFYL